MKNYLVVSALGEDRPGLVNELSRVILECDCSIVDSRMTVLGSELAITLLAQGNWNSLAKLEVQLKRLEHSLAITLIIKRTELRKPRANILPYTVEVVAIYQAGIVHSLANFFATRFISIEDLVTRSYSAPHTGTPMFSVTMTIGVPADTHIALLREEFMDFCDELNLDAIMEPIKAWSVLAWSIVIDQPVPDFSATATGNQTLRLSDFKGKNVVLYFYPKDNTPGCTLEGQQFRDRYAQFSALNTQIIGVSRDSLSSHERFCSKHNFSFTLICDEDEKLCKLFDVIKVKKLYGKEHLGIERSTFLIASDGVLKREWRKVKVNGHVDAVLSAIREL